MSRSSLVTSLAALGVLLVALACGGGGVAPAEVSPLPPEVLPPPRDADVIDLGGPFVDLAANGGICLLDRAGHVRCWWELFAFDEPKPFEPEKRPFDVPLETVTMWDGLVGGLSKGEFVMADYDGTLNRLDGGPFVEAQLDMGIGCARTAAGIVRCTEPMMEHYEPPPEVPFAHFALGAVRGCARNAAGAETCWGRWDDLPRLPESLPITRMVFSSDAACGLDEAGAIHCVGIDEEPVRGVFTDLVLDGRRACGLRDTGSIACWGNEERFEIHEPNGRRFSKMAILGFSICALNDQGDFMCWPMRAAR